MALTINKLPRYKGLSGTDPQIQDSAVTDDGTNIIIDRNPKLLNVSTPTTPASGYTQIYIDSADKHLKIKDDTGTITDFSNLALSGPLDIVNGGTGEATAQDAINALTDVASTTNEYVLTKDTATGNAIFKAPTGGAFTDSATNVYLTTTTDDVIIGNTSPVSSAKFTVDGEADQIQTVIQGHSTQTGNILEVQKSDGTVVFAVSETGVVSGGSGSTITAEGTNANLALQPNGTGNVTVSDGTDTTKIVSFEVSGATANKTCTITSSHTDNRTITLPNATDTLVGKATTDTLTNKRITQRVVTTTDDATAVIDVDVTDVYELSAVANATTFSTTGTPTDGQKLIIRFKDAGVAKGLTWDGVFVAIGVTAPTTTVVGKWHYVGATYNSNASKWHILATGVQA